MTDTLREPLLGLKPRGRLPVVDTSIESVQYNPPTNKLRVQQHKLEGQERRHVYGYTGHTAVARVSTIVAGVLIGVTAVVIQSSIEQLVLLRNGLLQSLFSNGALGTGQAVATWAGISVAAVVFSGALVQLFAPKAAGAGVTLVMAFLNGNDIRGLLNLPVFIIKIVGLICSRVAGLAVGPEGPMVHLGACIASMVYEWEPWFMRRAATEGGAGQLGRQGGSRGQGGSRTNRAGSSLPPSGREGAPEGAAVAAGGSGVPGSRAVFKNADHRELVSAGAAAGIAAAFGAPIGGVLFSLEEAATHWSRKVGWRCFLCTTCASFTLAQLHPRSQSGMLPFKSNSPLTNEQWLMQAPFIIIVSACGGLLGAAFNVLRKKLWPIRASRRRTVLRLAEAAGVALATVGLTAGLALYFGSCLPLPESWLPHHGVRLTCPPGKYNDLGTALLGSDVWVIRTLLNLGGEDMPVHKSCSLWSPCYFSWPSLALLSASYLLLMALASSLCLPGGLFMPSIISGGAFGALFGFFLRRVLPSAWDIQPGVYALLCATAVLGGVFRSTFSLVVIVVEGTRGIDFLFGIILSILFSNLVASRVLPDGVYESELERDGQLYYLRPEAPWALRSKTAEDMMATPVAGLEALVPVQGVRSLLAATTHNGFPVYASGEPRDPATGMGRLVGFVTRSQLEVLLRRKAYCNAAGAYVGVPPAGVAAYEEQLNFEMRQAQATVVMQPALPWQPPLPHAQSSAGLSRLASGRRSTRWRPLLGTAGSGLQRGERGGSQASLAPASHERQLEEGLLPGDPAAEAVIGANGDATIRTLEEAAAAAGVLAAAAAAAAGSSAALTPHPNGLEAAGSSWAAAGGTTAATAGSTASVMGASASEDGYCCDDEPSAAGLFLNLAPFMDTAPLVVRPGCLGTVAHHLFLAMSMRHLLVVDDRMGVVGIITRKDLDHAAGEGWWRINKIAPHPHHETGLRRHQSWLAYSLAAPRRLLSAVQRVVSPVPSPRASRRGTPAASPGGTPRASRLGTPAGTPRASDLEAGSAVFGGGGGGAGAGDSSSSGPSSFWSPGASSGAELLLGGSSSTDSEVAGVTAAVAAAADGGLVAAAASTASASRGFADFVTGAAHSGEEVQQQQQQQHGRETASVGSAPAHVPALAQEGEGEGELGGSSPAATPQSSWQHRQPHGSGEGEEAPPGTSPFIQHAGMPGIDEEHEGQQAEQGQPQGEGPSSRASTPSPGHSSSGSGGGTPGRAPRRVRIIDDAKRHSSKLQSFGSLVHPDGDGHGGG